MNIGQLLRSLTGTVRPGEPSVLNLKPGQLVKGQVLQMLDGGEALLLIDGVKLKAQLETPLQAGQQVLLQVQAEERDGMAVLKPMEGAVPPLTEEGAEQLLRQLGIAGSGPQHREAVRLLQGASLPLQRETVEALARVLAAKPGSVEPGSWAQAAVVAASRGLPLEPDTVAAVHRVIAGPPLAASLAQLEQLAGQALASGEPADGPARGALRELLEAAAALRRLAAAPGGGPASASSGPGAAPPSGAAAAAQPQGAPPGALAGEAPQAATGRAPAAEAPSGAPAPAAQAAPASAARGEAAAAPRAEAALAGQAAPGGTPQGPAAAAASAGAAAPGPASAAPGGTLAAGEAAAGPAAQPEAAGDGGGAWLARVLKAIGVDYERQIASRLLGGSAEADGTPERPGGPGADSRPAPGAQPPGALPVLAPADQPAAELASLKSALLRLSASGTELPAPLREAVQQTLQHVTGQQLLLAADRTNPLAYVTVTVPLQVGEHRRDAAVHIQSRREGTGRLDAANCRLLFDLQMDRLGPTLVDVLVVDRAVSVTVQTDHPAAGILLESGKEALAGQLELLGFPYVTMRTTPMTREEQVENALPASEPGSRYAAKRYKGVDMRI
ncbi:hypothetical protein J31TS4_00710 [Paenibacillus sp. J31TS4]|uniref:hypothetical protein n=1 Tax=Paenibacillus sp. J31TS4 TaxID=2807195 RepID=UPI001B00ADC4|nr:hypothetical protein [Paenibacillus sp. J31TS4]GIP36791.1 hypothetical protein J31TS4_00710 [Paenibacillus sp. J31TS4]